MSKKRTYPLSPRKLKGSAWFYETRHGIEVVQEHWVDGKCQGTSVSLIPWSKVTAAVDNHRAIKRQRTKP
jgi:hypothetical protein